MKIYDKNNNEYHNLSWIYYLKTKAYTAVKVDDNYHKILDKDKLKYHIYSDVFHANIFDIDDVDHDIINKDNVKYLKNSISPKIFIDDILNDHEMRLFKNIRVNAGFNCIHDIYLSILKLYHKNIYDKIEPYLLASAF